MHGGSGNGVVLCEVDGDRDEYVVVFGFLGGGEELFQERDNLAGFWVSGLGMGKGGGLRFGIGDWELGVAWSEAEARVGLLATAGGFVEDGTINLGNQNVVVEPAGGIG